MCKVRVEIARGVYEEPIFNCTPLTNFTKTDKQKKEPAVYANSLNSLVGDAGFEPATPAV